MGSTLGVFDGRRFYQRFCGWRRILSWIRRAVVHNRARGMFPGSLHIHNYLYSREYSTVDERVPRNNYCQTESGFSAIIESCWFRVEPQIIRDGLN